MKVKHLTSTLVILVIWYLTMSFVLMELNPCLWDVSAMVFVIMSTFISIAYILLKEE